MNVVGIDRTEWNDDHVHTIDIWYSARHQAWLVERLNVHGSLVGVAHRCATLEDAEACLAEWLRSHGEAHVTSAREHVVTREDSSRTSNATAEAVPEQRRTLNQRAA